jgi:hypothetical protein
MDLRAEPRREESRKPIGTLEDAVTFRLSSAWPQKHHNQPENNKYQQSGDYNPYQGVLKFQPIEIRLHFRQPLDSPT